jgi:hypothetical protein
MFTEILTLKVETEPAEASGRMNLPSASAAFLPGLRFDCEYGGDMFLYKGLALSKLHGITVEKGIRSSYPCA